MLVCTLNVNPGYELILNPALITLLITVIVVLATVLLELTLYVPTPPVPVLKPVTTVFEVIPAPDNICPIVICPVLTAVIVKVVPDCVPVKDPFVYPVIGTNGVKVAKL